MSYLMSASSAASSACGVRLPAVVMAASASGTRLTVHVPLPACATVESGHGAATSEVAGANIH